MITEITSEKVKHGQRREYIKFFFGIFPSFLRSLTTYGNLGG